MNNKNQPPTEPNGGQPKAGPLYNATRANVLAEVRRLEDAKDAFDRIYTDEEMLLNDPHYTLLLGRLSAFRQVAIDFAAEELQNEVVDKEQ